MSNDDLHLGEINNGSNELGGKVND